MIAIALLLDSKGAFRTVSKERKTTCANRSSLWMAAGHLICSSHTGGVSRDWRVP
jgi:hypothetical protein